jgi:hypothetical protein
VLEHSIKSMFVPARQLRCVCPSESLMRHRTEKFYHERLVNTHACKIRCTDASTHVRSRFADCCTIVQTRHKRASRTALPTLLPTSNVIDLRCGPVPKNIHHEEPSVMSILPMPGSPHFVRSPYPDPCLLALARWLPIFLAQCSTSHAACRHPHVSQQTFSTLQQ